MSGKADVETFESLHDSHVVEWLDDRKVNDTSVCCSNTTDITYS